MGWVLAVLIVLGCAFLLIRRLYRTKAQGDKGRTQVTGEDAGENGDGDGGE